MVLPTIITLSSVSSAQAGPFDRLIPKNIPNPFKTGTAGKEAEEFLRDQIGKNLGEQAPFVIDPNTAFQQAPAGQTPTQTDFRPTELKTLRDLNRPLPAGDYSFHAMFYCTQWSVHRPGRGHPYTLGRAQGRLAKQMSVMLFRGTVRHVAPATLNAMAWRIQAGVPLSKWSDGEKSLVRGLMPEYEKDLEGDWLQRTESSYNSTFRLATHKSFDDEMKTLGGLGQLALNMESAHQTLSDTRVVDERLPDLMFQEFGAGGSPQLPDDSDHPSPWMSVSPGVMARFTVHEGNLGDNQMDLRITPEADSNGDGPTLSKIMTGSEKGDGLALVGYSPDSQSPLIEPVVTDQGDDYQEPDLCPSKKLMAGKSQKDQDKLRRLYYEVLGIKERLRARRDHFLKTLDAQDVFSTFYYHTTVNGLALVNQGLLSHPDVSLEQIIEFYDAYEYNYDSAMPAREAHWKLYYETAQKLTPDVSNSLSLATLLYRGAQAHIFYDLPRALRDVISRPENRDDSLAELKGDFYQFDAVFSTTSQQSFHDLSTAISSRDGTSIIPVATDLIPNGAGVWFALSDRHDAWDRATGDQVPKALGPQPRIDDSTLENEGKRSCPESQTMK